MRKGALVFTIGLVLFFIGVGLVVPGVMSENQILITIGVVISTIGGLTQFAGIVMYSIDKGYGAGLGILFACLGLIGFIILAVMEDKSAPPPRARRGPPGLDDDEDMDRPPDEDEEEDRSIRFQGALDGEEVDLAGNRGLVRAGLQTAKTVVEDGIKRRAEVVRVEPRGQQGSKVKLIVDGMPVPGGRLPGKRGLAVTQMLKLLAGLDIEERTTRQSGGINAEWRDTPFKLLVESVPVKGGQEGLIVRIENLKTRITTPEEVGFTDELGDKVRELVHQKSGVFAVCGPPDSGVTTTFYAVLQAFDRYMFQAYTFMPLDHREVGNIPVFEVESEDDLETSFHRVLRAEADVVVLPPFDPADVETVRTVFEFQKKAAMLTEFQAKDSVTGVRQLCQWVGKPKIVAEGLRGVLTQKLIRTLCERCKQAYRPNPKMLKQLNLPPETKLLYRRPRPPHPDDEDAEEYEPCRRCDGLGYLGRTAMFELLDMTDKMQQIVASGADPQAMKACMKEEGMLTFQTDGLRLVAEGKTGIDELKRVFQSGS